MMTLPENYTVSTIPSGCCGMAGSFGYEKEHYDISQKIGELVLLPTVRQQTAETLIAAPGTSLPPPDKRRDRTRSPPPDRNFIRCLYRLGTLTLHHYGIRNENRPEAKDQ
ncbi:hypothetical protein ACQ86N_32160 [Puia sp. P3]|uniref:hypothetical protein n=1 Tax=Puia sp. P3 TaxID=3423952 RepID=UPI003D679DF0